MAARPHAWAILRIMPVVLLREFGQGIGPGSGLGARRAEARGRSRAGSGRFFLEGRGRRERRPGGGRFPRDVRKDGRGRAATPETWGRRGEPTRRPASGK